MGHLYRIRPRNLPGRPEIAVDEQRKAIFVHDCFWHQHPGCPDADRLTSNFHRAKATTIAAGDDRNIRELTKVGWDSLVVWKCQTEDINPLIGRLRTFLGNP